jgi:hypothetical protein
VCADFSQPSFARYEQYADLLRRAAALLESFSTTEKFLDLMKVRW